MKKPAHKNDPKETSPVRKLVNGIKWTVSALIFPLSWRKIGVFLATWFLAHPMSTLLFPRAEDVLKKEGLDPKIAQELAPGKTVYVREDNFLGALHATFDKGPFKAPMHYLHYVSPNSHVAAFTQNNFSYVFNNTSRVYMKPSTKEDIDPLTNALFETSSLSEEIRYQKTLLHEIHHASDENKMLFGVEKEADCDRYAIEALAREMNDPTLKDKFLNNKSFFFIGGDHDTALYLDAHFRQVSTPTCREMEIANAEAAIVENKILVKMLAQKVLSLKNNDNIAGIRRDVLEKALRYDPGKEHLSALAARRVELYLQALKVYMPAAADQEKGPVLSPIS